MMKKIPPAASAEAYVAALDGWRRDLVAALRSGLVANRALEEAIKWGNLVYLSNGPVAVVRAEAARVVLGFWRGQRLREIEPRLTSGGKFEMARIDLREGDSVSDRIVRRLSRAAVELNRTLGDPTALGRS